MLQLSIEIPAPAAYAVGFALAVLFIAIAIRHAWPILNDMIAPVNAVLGMRSMVSHRSG